MSFFILIGRFLFLFTSIIALIACGSGSNSSASSNTKTFAVSGAIYLDSRTNVDDDVMRLGELNESNNQLANAQLLSNVVTLGGYLSGREGLYTNVENLETHYLKDTKDFYRVNLLQGQQIRITTFNAADDLTTQNVLATLHLQDEHNFEISAPSIQFNSETSKVINVSEDGEYIIEISAEDENSDPILYTLSISRAQSTQLSETSTYLNPRSEFVPGEIVIKFKDQSHTSTNNSKIHNAETSDNPLAYFESKYLVRQKKDMGNSGFIFTTDAPQLGNKITFESGISKTPEAKALHQKLRTLSVIEHLQTDPNVLYAEPNYLYSASSERVTVNDPLYNQQWNLPMLGVPAAWQASTGESVTVAVIDTGINVNHLDNPLNLMDGYDFISDNASADDQEQGPDDNPHDTGPFQHGSHVTGIIAAATNNALGVSGIAYHASIMPLRVLGVDNKGTNSDIATAILYAAGISNATGQLPSKKADIINLSLGGEDKSNQLEEAIESALAEGVIIVAASGNEGSTTPHYPAAFEGVVGVSSINENKILSNFSNHGDYVDVAAPGGTSVNNILYDGFQDGVLSTFFASEYVQLTGTSMAAPHVSAIAALMKAINTHLTNTTFDEALRSGSLTDNLNNPIYYGNGLINAAKSVNWALNSQGRAPLPPSLGMYPTKLGFIGANTQAILELKNHGTGTLLVDVSSENEWIEINKTSVDINTGLGQYPIKVNSAILTENGTNNGEISVQYNLDGVEQEAITIDVFNTNVQETNANVGTLLVSLSLVDGSTPEEPLQTFALVEAIKGDDVYHYEFSNVPQGEYFLQASTDHDGDSQRFDAGEAKGQYPLPTQAQYVRVNNASLDNVNFSVQYQAFPQAK